MLPNRQLRRTGAVVLCLGGLLSGCGGSTIRPGPTEQTIRTFVYEHTGFHATDVRCPAGVPAKGGTRFQCHFTGPEGRYTAYLRILSVQGQRVLYDIVTHPDSRSVKA